MQEPTIGLNVQPEPPRMGDLLQRLMDMRIRHVRSSWHLWSHNDGGPAGWDWMPHYRNAGIEVQPIIYENEDVSYGRRYYDFTAQFGAVPYIQLGNEFDGRRPDEPSPTYIEGRNLALHLRESVREIELHDPNVRIVSPALAWNRHGVADFAEGMISVPRAFDVLAINIYGDEVFGEPLSRFDVLRQRGWKGPIWCSEIGVGQLEADKAGCELEEYQRRNYEEVFMRDTSRFGYERIYPFQANPTPEGWNIVREDATLRPAAELLKNCIASHR